MACCNAILERCDPAGPAGDNTVLIFVNSDGSPPAYKNIDGTDWAGDPTTLTNCAGGADTTAIVDDGAGNVTITNPDTGDTTAMALADNGDGTASATIGGATCVLSAEDTELLCDTPDPGMATLETTNLKSGVVSGESFTAVNAGVDLRSAIFNQWVSDNTVPAGFTVSIGTVNFVLPCDQPVTIFGMHENYTNGGYRGDIAVPSLVSGIVFNVEAVIDGGAPIRISGLTTVGSATRHNEFLTVGQIIEPLTKGAHSIEFRVVLYRNDMDTSGHDSPANFLTQGMYTVNWSELKCCQ